MYSINKHCILTPAASQNTYLGEHCSPKTPREGIEKLVAAMYNKDKLEFMAFFNIKNYIYKFQVAGSLNHDQII